MLLRVEKVLSPDTNRYFVLAPFQPRGLNYIAEIDLSDQIIDSVIVEHGSVFLGNLISGYAGDRCHNRKAAMIVSISWLVNARGFCFLGPFFDLGLPGLIVIHPLFLPAMVRAINCEIRK
jgi:predicted MFS family arabinose efflux permease